MISIVLVAMSFHLAAANGPSKPPPAPAPVAPPIPPPPPAKSLFDRLGGKDAIKAVVHDFVGNVAADKVINKRFAKTDTKKLEASLVDQICQATGGPCKYAGKSMAEAHNGMKITDAEWDATVGDLKKALDKNKVPAAEQKDLLTPLAAMKTDIVGK